MSKNQSTSRLGMRQKLPHFPSAQTGTLLRQTGRVGVGTFSERPDDQGFQLCTLSVLQLLQSAPGAREQPRTKQTNECGYVTTELYLWIPKLQLHINLTYHRIVFSYFSTFKNVKNILSLWAYKDNQEGRLGSWTVVCILLI